MKYLIYLKNLYKLSLCEVTEKSDMILTSSYRSVVCSYLKNLHFLDEVETGLSSYKKDDFDKFVHDSILFMICFYYTNVN